MSLCGSGVVCRCGVCLVAGSVGFCVVGVGCVVGVFVSLSSCVVVVGGCGLGGVLVCFVSWGCLVCLSLARFLSGIRIYMHVH